MLKKHPFVWTVISIVCISFPQWASGTWALVSSEPLFTFIHRTAGSYLTYVVKWLPTAAGLLLGLVVLAIQWCNRNNATGQSPAASLPEKRPKVVPVKYGPSADGYYGLYVRNDGEPAFDVSVHDVLIGTSRLAFWNEFPGIDSRTPEVLFCAHIEVSPNQGVTGSGLRDEMIKQNIDEVVVSIRYKDINNQWYLTRCRLERDFHHGVRAGFVRQELIAPPMQPTSRVPDAKPSIDSQPVNIEVLATCLGNVLSLSETTLFLKLRLAATTKRSFQFISGEVCIASDATKGILLDRLTEWILIRRISSSYSFASYNTEDVDLDTLALMTGTLEPGVYKEGWVGLRVEKIQSANPLETITSISVTLRDGFGVESECIVTRPWKNPGNDLVVSRLLRSIQTD